MIRSIPRKKLFQQQIFIDVFIASMQQAYASDFDDTNVAEAKVLKRYYDHQQSFIEGIKDTDINGVIGYAAQNKSDYSKQLPLVLANFFAKLSAQEIYLLDFLNGDFTDIEFANYTQKNQFKRLVGKSTTSHALVLNQHDIASIVSLFLFSKFHNRPRLFFIAKDIPLALSLCDDGNFHYYTYSEKKDMVLDAANRAGFLIGDLQLCQTHSIYYLK